MKKTLIAFCAAALLTACQKEPDLVDPGNPTGGGGTGGGTTTQKNSLRRQVQVNGTDSTIMDFTYDASGRPVGLKYSDAGDEAQVRLVRNSSGVLTRMVIIADGLFQQGVVDSITTNLFYNSGSSQYTHSRIDATISGVPVSDSSAYTYSGGKITSVTSYSKLAIPGMSYQPYAKSDYTYSGSNVSSVKSYDYSAVGTLTLSNTVNYTYDTKVNAITLGAEGVLLSFPTMVGDNNVTKEDDIDPGPPPSTSSYTSTYTYTSFNKPAGGTMIESPGGASTALRFYYN